MSFQQITIKADIDQLLASRDKAIKEFKQSMELMREANKTMMLNGYGEHVMAKVIRCSSIYSLRTDGDTADILHKFTRELDRALWQHVGKLSGLDSIMDQTARTEWERGFENNDFPECTRENLENTFKQLHGQRGLIFNRGLVKAFASLSGNYKTNDAFKIGKKVIMSGVSSYSRGYGSSYLHDVERVLYVLDGKKPPEHHSDTVHGPIDRIKGWNGPGCGEFETPYMHVKLFLNNNAHVKFLRPDLIDKANKIIAAYYGETLPNGSNAA